MAVVDCIVSSVLDQASFHQVKGGPTLFSTVCNFLHNLHTFLDILELGIEKKHCVEKICYENQVTDL